MGVGVPKRKGKISQAEGLFLERSGITVICCLADLPFLR